MRKQVFVQLSVKEIELSEEGLTNFIGKVSMKRLEHFHPLHSVKHINVVVVAGWEHNLIRDGSLRISGFETQLGAFTCIAAMLVNGFRSLPRCDRKNLLHS